MFFFNNLPDPDFIKQVISPWMTQTYQTEIYTRKMQLVVLLFCAIVALAAAQNVNPSETIELSLPAGKIRGSFMTTRLGKRIYAFRALRYAEPPVGERRFKQAVPVAPWRDVFDATQEGPSCPQPRGLNQAEDCLRLNVYTTKLPSGGSTKGIQVKKPVIVYLHAGAFYVFSGQSSLIGPQYLLDQDVVLVSVNYRLGSLGFLSTGDAVAPGNLGLKDQVEALRWVKKNIAAFGGDPNSVTLMGYSAGGSSVGVHLVSPMSKGLFHRAVAMSGNAATYQTPPPHDQMDLAKKQATFMGCPNDTSRAIVDCLKTKDAIEIAATLPKFFEWYGDPVVLWGPVVEPEVPGVERFLAAQPVDLIRQGKFHHVPFITGVCKDELGGVVVGVVQAARKGDNKLIDEINANWTTIGPISHLYERNTPRSLEISAALKQFYFNGKLTLENMDGLAHIYADSLTIFSVDRYAKLMAPVSRAPVYYYEFAYQGRYSHSVWSDTKKPYGVVHHDDLLYIFRDEKFPYFQGNDPEVSTVERMTSIWANFAKTGEPIPRNNPKFGDFVWTPFTLKDKKYLQITDKLVMKTNLYGDRMDEWSRLFPLKPVPK